jgi:sec-independent protein translocase protein TatC
LARCGLVSADVLRRYRRHAFVVLMILAACVTPPDIFTMFLVCVPLYLLYEVSIWVIRR